MWQPGWEGSFGENGYIHMYGWVTLLCTWNYHNIIHQTYSSIEKKFLKIVAGERASSHLLACLVQSDTAPSPGQAVSCSLCTHGDGSSPRVTVMNTAYTLSQRTAKTQTSATRGLSQRRKEVSLMKWQVNWTQKLEFDAGEEERQEVFEKDRPVPGRALGREEGKI